MSHLRRLEKVIEDDRTELPPLARDICRLLLEQGATAPIGLGQARNTLISR